MRISDWSSDVCSSDLPSSFAIDSMPPACCKMSVRFMAFLHLRRGSKCADRGWYSSAQAGGESFILLYRSAPICNAAALRGRFTRGSPQHEHFRQDQGRDRSEEHTSELQSLIRISYAV